MPDNIAGEAACMEKIEAINAYLQRMGIRELMIVKAFCPGLIGEKKGESA